MFTIWYTYFAWSEYRNDLFERFQRWTSPAASSDTPKSPINTPTTPVSVPEPPKPESPVIPRSAPIPTPSSGTANHDVPFEPPKPKSEPKEKPKTQPPPRPDPKVQNGEQKPKKASPPGKSIRNDFSPQFMKDDHFDVNSKKNNSPDQFKDNQTKPPAADSAEAFLNSEIKSSHIFRPSSSTNDSKDTPKSKAKGSEMVSQQVLEKLESEFAKLEASDSKSLLKKYLSREIFDNLKTKQTSFGSTLLDVIQSGLANHDSGVGIYAPDAESYTVFADLFDPIIEDYHGGFKKTDKHPPKDFGDVSSLGNLDPTGEFVVSTRVRCGRSLEGYPFNPCLTEEQYKEMEAKVSSTLSGLEGELKGTFFPLTGMAKDVQQKLIDDHFLFKEGDRFLQAANACRFWPSGRGIFHNDNKTFLVWCNEEDHLRIISMQMGGDLGEVYRRLVTAVNDIEKRIPFSHNDRLGFLTFCPTNLGTTIRASVHIKVPKLAANKAKLDEVAGKFNLQVRGTRGEHTEAEGGIYDISNKRRMGLTEYQAVKEMYDGINELIKIEREL